jgi:hypothetical protein
LFYHNLSILGINRQQSRHHITLDRSLSGGSEDGGIDVMNEEYMNTFWQRHFENSQEIPWFE